MHTVGPLHLWTPNCKVKTVQVFIEKNLHVSGTAQFQPVLFKGQHLNLTSQELPLLGLKTDTGSFFGKMPFLNHKVEEGLPHPHF